MLVVNKDFQKVDWSHRSV